MQAPVRNEEFMALIRLLDDPDHNIYLNVSDKLVSIGRNAIPLLECEWESSSNSDIQNRIEDIIHQIEFDDCKLAFQNWLANDNQNLLEGALILSRFQYPEQELDTILATLAQLRKDVWLELNDNLTSLEKVRVINHILYEVHNFSGDIKYKESVQNAFFNNVLDFKKGSPTSLGILYKIIADQLELPISGINLPGHFILAYMDVTTPASEDILFYINPFSHGVVFGKGELERYIGKMELSIELSDLHPISNVQILKRSLKEIRACYKNSGAANRANEIDQLLEIIRKHLAN